MGFGLGAATGVYRGPDLGEAQIGERVASRMPSLPIDRPLPSGVHSRLFLPHTLPIIGPASGPCVIGRDAPHPAEAVRGARGRRGFPPSLSCARGEIPMLEQIQDGMRRIFAGGPWTERRQQQRRRRDRRRASAIPFAGPERRQVQRRMADRRGSAWLRFGTPP